MSMVLSSRRLICGINPIIAKKICKMCRTCPRSSQEVASELSISVLNAENWLVSLAEAEYLNIETEGKKLLWYCTPRGYTAIATARSGTPLSGAEFSELLCSIVRRAEAYNKSEIYPLYIEKIYAFGAVFTQPWQIEDPNIAIVTHERPEFSICPDWRLNYWITRDPEKHISITDQLFFPENELYRCLKKPKEHFSIYRQDISELSDERRLLFDGGRKSSSGISEDLMTVSDIRILGEKIDGYRNAELKKRRQGAARIQNEKIVDYWKDSDWFLGLNIPTGQEASCCWRCGGSQDIQQCHIVPDALGGSFEEPNLVLLCARCHAEGPNLRDDKVMLDWIKSYREKYEGDFWVEMAMAEYKQIYDKDIRREVEELLCKEKMQIETDEAMDELRLLVNEASTKAIFHFGQTWLNNASMAGCFRLALEQLPDHLRRL